MAEKFNKEKKIPERNQGDLEKLIAEAKRLLKEAKKWKKNFDDDDLGGEASAVVRR